MSTTTWTVCPRCSTTLLLDHLAYHWRETCPNRRPDGPPESTPIFDAVAPDHPEALAHLTEVDL